MRPFYINPNFSYISRSDRNSKEMHSADGKIFLCGSHGNWEVHIFGIHIASFFRREHAREFIRGAKGKTN